MQRFLEHDAVQDDEESELDRISGGEVLSLAVSVPPADELMVTR